MATTEDAEAVKKAKVLMVGAGGIGCELLKILVLTGFKDIELIDLDTIDVSNLNRQFLFRKRHVGQSKAKVAREAMLKFRPDANIVAHHANVKDPKFDVEYFQKFNLVMNGLDNLDARRHVNRLCLAAGTPLVESGTTGYLGQVTVHVKGRTQCYECEPKPVPKTYPTCTITNTPSKPVHCIVWAKELPFVKLFGDRREANDLDTHVSTATGAAGDSTDGARDESSNGATEELEECSYELGAGESPSVFSRKIFDRIFGSNVARTLEMEGLWQTRKPPTPLFLQDVLTSDNDVRPDCFTRAVDDSIAVESVQRTTDDKSSLPTQVSAAAALGLTNPQAVWTLAENTQVFLKSVELILETRHEEVGSLTFDKDDQLAVEFVTSASNLRSFSFGIPPLSLFEAKGIAGNIIHAIATTNAIVGGLVVLEAIKLLTGRLDELRTTFLSEMPNARGKTIHTCLPEPPNPNCYVCSNTRLELEVNTDTVTLGSLISRIVRGKLAVSSPFLMHGNSVLYETGEGLEEDEIMHYEANLKKTLKSFPAPIVSGSVLSVEDDTQQFKCSLRICHREEFDEKSEDQMVLLGELPPPSTAVNTELDVPLTVNEAVDDDELDLVLIVPNGKASEAGAPADSTVSGVGKEEPVSLKRKSDEEGARVKGKKLKGLVGEEEIIIL